jgi:hypothetical protein
MAKAKKPAAKTNSAILGKPKDKGYTKGKLIAHLAAATSTKGVGEISKKQVAAVLEELTNVVFTYATVGAVIPGLGKLVLKKIPAKPARTIVSFGKEIQVAKKPASQKLAFRFSKDAKAKFAK